MIIIDCLPNNEPMSNDIIRFQEKYKLSIQTCLSKETVPKPQARLIYKFEEVQFSSICTIVYFVCAISFAKSMSIKNVSIWTTLSTKDWGTFQSQRNEK